MKHPEDDTTLLSKARAGDRSALKLLLVRIHRGLKLHIASRIPCDLRSIADPDDIIQEASVAIFRRIGSFEPQGPGSFYGWARTIAENILNNAIERERAEKRGGNRRLRLVRGEHGPLCPAPLDWIPGAEHTPTWHLRRKEGALWFEAAMNRLPDNYRRAVTLAIVEQYSRKEAAAQMGVTVRAFDGLLRRAREILCNELGSPLHFLSSKR